MVDALQRHLYGKITYQVSSSISSHSHIKLMSNSTFFCNGALSNFNDNSETSRLKKILQRQNLRTKVHTSQKNVFRYYLSHCQWIALNVCSDWELWRAKENLAWNMRRCSSRARVLEPIRNLQWPHLASSRVGFFITSFCPRKDGRMHPFLLWVIKAEDSLLQSLLTLVLFAALFFISLSLMHHLATVS